MKWLFSFLLCLWLLPLTAGSNRGDLIIGVWSNSDGRAKVEIYKIGHRYYGKLIWLKYPLKDGKPKLDWKNPDPAKRNRPVIGLVLMRGFLYEGDYTWSDGEIYDPDSGNDYSCRMKLIDRNTMEVRGFIGISLIGRSDTWVRVEK